jgi:hypothetical protein
MNENSDSQPLEPENGSQKEPVTIEVTNEPGINKDDTQIKFLSKFSALSRIAIYAIVLIVVVLIAWGVGALVTNGTQASSELTPTSTVAPTKVPGIVSTPAMITENKVDGISRRLDMEAPQGVESTNRQDVFTYTVEAGDNIFDIAQKFGLKPETVLWSNRYTLGDTPDGLGIGVDLVILPVDGLYHRWSEGEGLNGVASFYGVDPDVIVNYPLNGLSKENVGDYANPNIQPGTMLVVPGGTRPNVSWVSARDEEVSGNSYLGPGACGGIIYGNVGTGSFTWPTTAHWLSGYEYNPPVHNGLDFGGDFGSPIYAADSGVIVYSGWSDRGYGNLIVIDHDGGWQTYYSHMIDGTLLPCGSNVQKGQLIASMGSTGNSTGPHLHFEMRLNGYPVNPWDFLN